MPEFLPRLRRLYGDGADQSNGHSGLRPTLKWHHLVGVTFFAVCGGDYGIEDSVGAAGPAYTMIGLLVVPWIWSLPIALMTAELGSMIPEAGGPVVWVSRAFGPFVAHQNALIHLVANTFDNALYPVMFADYLRAFPMLNVDGVSRWLLSFSMLAFVTVLNLLGVDTVANVSTLFTVLVISPFLVLVIAGLPTLDPSAWRIGPSTPVDWSAFISVLLWNTSGYDSVGALAAEVVDPGRNFPIGMAVSIVLVTLVYVLPVGVGVSLDVGHDFTTWTDGSFTLVAEQHVGHWLAAWISLGGAFSAFGLLNTLLCAAARIVVSSAEIGALPSSLARIDAASGVPRAATFALSLILAVAIVLPFAELVEISMLFYGVAHAPPELSPPRTAHPISPRLAVPPSRPALPPRPHPRAPSTSLHLPHPARAPHCLLWARQVTTLAEMLALIRLRELEPGTRRPYRVPLANGWLLLASLPPMGLCVLLVLVARPAAWLLLALTLGAGGLTYCLRSCRCAGDDLAAVRPHGSHPKAASPPSQGREMLM